MPAKGTEEENGSPAVGGGPAVAGFAFRMSAFYGAVFLVAGTQMPYLPVWLDYKGLSAREIAIITATPMVVRILVTPAIAFLADRYGDHRRTLIMLAWAGLVALALLTGTGGFWPILLLVMAFALFWTSIMPLAETIALSGVRGAGLDYGRMRLWGSITFIVASFAGGLAVEHWGAPAAIWTILAGGAATALAAHLLPQPIRAAEAQGPPRRLSLADAAGLLRSGRFMLFLAAVGAVQAAHAVLYTFGTLHWRQGGISATWCGILWTIGVVAEIALFAWSKPVVARLGPLRLIALAALAAIVRWTAMSLDPPLALLVPLQVLHAITFGAAHLGAVHYMASAIPQTQGGTAQALYASVTSGIAMGTAILSAGQLYAAFAGRAYLGMAVLGLVSLAAILLLMRVERRPPVAPADGGGAR